MGSTGSPGSNRSSAQSSPRSSLVAIEGQQNPGLGPPDVDQRGNQGLLHGETYISPGGSDEEGEFSAIEFDLESELGSDFGSGNHESQAESETVSSSILEHSFVNGRRYHKYRHGRYPIPNDETEQNREDILHTMMMEATDGRLYYSPIGDRPQKIADLGTGTGIWAIEMGDRFPSAEVLGVDLSPIQPVWVPHNVQFIVDDIEASWLNGDDFDFIHLRNMIPILKSPVDLLKQVYHNMRPGGWVELQDVDGDVHTDDDTVPDDWALRRFTGYIVQAFAKFGTTAKAAIFGEQYLREAGFVNIKHNYIKLPYGTWPKNKLMRLVGMYYRTACEIFFPAVGVIHFPMLGWDKTEMEVFFAECRQAMRDPSVHAYGKMHFWSGQKPIRKTVSSSEDE